MKRIEDMAVVLQHVITNLSRLFIHCVVMLQPLHPMVLKWKGIKWCYQVPSKEYNPSLSYLSSMPWPLWGAGSVVATRHTAMASRNRSVGIRGWKTKPSLWYRWGQNCAWSKYCKILLNIADMQKPTYPCKVSAIFCIYHSSFLNNLVYTFYHFCAELLGSFKSLELWLWWKSMKTCAPSLWTTSAAINPCHHGLS